MARHPRDRIFLVPGLACLSCGHAGGFAPARCPVASRISGGNHPHCSGLRIPGAIYQHARVPGRYPPGAENPGPWVENAFFKCFQPMARAILFLAGVSAHSTKALEGCAYLFRPMYAEANMRHPPVQNLGSAHEIKFAGLPLQFKFSQNSWTLKPCPSSRLFPELAALTWPRERPWLPVSFP